MDGPLLKRMIAPLTDDIDIERHERSWTLVAGSRRWSFTKVDCRTVTVVPRVIDHRRSSPRMPLTTIVGAMLALIAGAATLGLALHSGTATAGDRYVLSVPLPSRIAARPRPSPSTDVVAAVRSQPMALVAVPSPPDVMSAIRPGAPVREDDVAADDPVAIRLTAMQPAVSAAFRTGQMQQWMTADGSERGFVVAGPAEGRCRVLSILIKRGGDNQVESRRQCPAGSAETTAAAPTGAGGDGGTADAGTIAVQ